MAADKKLTEREDLPGQQHKLDEQLSKSLDETAADRLPGDRKKTATEEETQQEQKESD